MRDTEIHIIRDALKAYCTNLGEVELTEAAERFVDYLDLVTDVLASNDPALTEPQSGDTVETGSVGPYSHSPVKT